jgi:hypothetical protein
VPAGSDKRRAGPCLEHSSARLLPRRNVGPVCDEEGWSVRCSFVLEAIDILSLRSARALAVVGTAFLGQWLLTRVDVNSSLAVYIMASRTIAMLVGGALGCGQEFRGSTSDRVIHSLGIAGERMTHNRRI